MNISENRVDVLGTLTSGEWPATAVADTAEVFDKTLNVSQASINSDVKSKLDQLISAGGSGSVDLSNYYTKAQVNEIISGLPDKAEDIMNMISTSDSPYISLCANYSTNKTATRFDINIDTPYYGFNDDSADLSFSQTISIPLVDGTNAGLMSPTQRQNLNTINTFYEAILDHNDLMILLNDIECTPDSEKVNFAVLYDGYNFSTTGLKSARVNADLLPATSTTAGVMTAADKVKLGQLPSKQIGNSINYNELELYEEWQFKTTLNYDQIWEIYVFNEEQKFSNYGKFLINNRTDKKCNVLSGGNGISVGSHDSSSITFRIQNIDMPSGIYYTDVIAFIQDII